MLETAAKVFCSGEPVRELYSWETSDVTLAAVSSIVLIRTHRLPSEDDVFELLEKWNTSAASFISLRHTLNGYIQSIGLNIYRISKLRVPYSDI